jgi:hypothetical protein
MYKSSLMCHNIEKYIQILECRKLKAIYINFEIKSNYKVDSIFVNYIYVIELRLITKNETLKNSPDKLPITKLVSHGFITRTHILLMICLQHVN